ncbi:hypothetical protein PT974_07153 [Cladobotryum mycophilum]|uniref:Uncharacterized protein n=1 Tax=Cladobotryum mycophilum TaxID=491253 RepID=A0ABR0SNL5_9HYPO
MARRFLVYYQWFKTGGSSSWYSRIGNKNRPYRKVDIVPEPDSHESYEDNVPLLY